MIRTQYVSILTIVADLATALPRPVGLLCLFSDYCISKKKINVDVVYARPDVGLNRPLG